MKGLILLIALGLAACSSSKKSKYDGHGAESLDAATLAKFAPKPVPSSQTERIERILDIRSTSTGHLAENGRNLYVNWKVTGTYQVWKVPGPKRYPIQLTGGQDHTYISFVSPNDKYLAVRRDSKGDEYYGLYLLSTKGGELQEVYRKKKVKVSPSFFTKDSRYLYYQANDKGPKTWTVYKYDIKKKTHSEVLVGEDGWWGVADHLDDGTLLVSRWTGNTSSEYYLWEPSKKKLEPLFGQGEKEEHSAKFGRSKNEILVLTNRFDEFRRLYKFQRGKKKPWKAFSPQWNYDIEGFGLNKSRTKVILNRNDKGYSRTGALSLASGKELKSPSVRGALQVYFNDLGRPHGRYSTMGVVKPNAPRVGYVYDWQTGLRTQWTIPSSPEVDTSGYVTPKLEYYPAKDGTKIPMFVYRPKQCEKKTCPVIVSFHGGPESQSTPWFSPSIQLYVQEGFVYVEPNVRGSDGYGKTWLHSDNGPKRLNVIGDIRDAGLYIKKNWAFDGKVPKVGVVGGSYGGYSAFIAMTMFAGTYDAGVAVVGMSSLLTFLQNTAPYRRDLRISEYGDPVKDKEALLKLSAMSYLDKLSAPILILHGATDPRVPAGEAVQIYEAMEEKGLPGELVLFPDEGHGIRKRKNRALSKAYQLNFFKKNLQ